MPNTTEALRQCERALLHIRKIALEMGERAVKIAPSPFASPAVKDYASRYLRAVRPPLAAAEAALASSNASPMEPAPGGGWRPKQYAPETRPSPCLSGQGPSRERLEHLIVAYFETEPYIPSAYQMEGLATSLYDAWMTEKEAL